MATEWDYNDFNKLNVVNDDGNDPDTSWQWHLDHSTANVKGGVDLAAAYGTKVYADAAGRVKLSADNKGSGGWILRVTDQYGYHDEYVHLSKFAVADGSTVAQGQLIAYSGASGYGSQNYYAPHLHRHRILPDFSKRINPWHYYGGDGIADQRDTKPGPIEYTLDTGIPNITYNRRFQYWTKQGGYAYTPSGFLSIPAWRGAQVLLRPYGYSGAIDGLPGLQTNKALQRLAAKYGYTGPIDGDLGTNSYKALSRFLNTL